MLLKNITIGIYYDVLTYNICTFNTNKLVRGTAYIGLTNSYCLDF